MSNGWLFSLFKWRANDQQSWGWSSTSWNLLVFYFCASTLQNKALSNKKQWPFGFRVYMCVCLSKIHMDVMTPFFFKKNLPNPKRSGVSPAVLFLIIQYVSWMTNLKLHQVRGRKMAFPIFFFQTGERRVKKDEKWGMKTKVTCVFVKATFGKKACSSRNNMFFFCFYPPSKSKDHYFAG